MIKNFDPADFRKQKYFFWPSGYIFNLSRDQKVKNFQMKNLRENDESETTKTKIP